MFVKSKRNKNTCIIYSDSKTKADYLTNSLPLFSQMMMVMVVSLKKATVHTQAYQASKSVWME